MDNSIFLKEFENSIKTAESFERDLKDAVEKAEKTSDWSKVKELTNRLDGELKTAKRVQGKLEGTETTELDFNKEYESMEALYKKIGIELPPDFSELMQDIWNKNFEDIKSAVEENGYGKALFIPDGLPNIKDLVTKTVGEVNWYINADKITESSNTGNRIVLVHSEPDMTNHPELLKTLGTKYGGSKTDGVDNKASDFIAPGYNLSLSEYLLLHKSIFDATGVHMDSKVVEGYILSTWLPGSRCGDSVVHAWWSSGHGRLCVAADSPADSDSFIGCRSSRCFK